MKNRNSRVFGCGGMALALLLSASAQAAITMTDIQIWAGSGPNRAALVIDWSDGGPALVWGFRWSNGATPNGTDMLMAVIGADARLRVPGLNPSTNFINTIEFDADGNGIFERSQSTSAGPYWGYVVNNDVYYDPVDFHLNSHIVSPNLTVVPNGNPFDGGAWVDSSTGIFDRPLANGSWDGFAYGEFNLSTFTGPSPASPIPALPVPEPGMLWGVGLVLLAFYTRR